MKEVEAYCRDRANRVDPSTFLDHYQSNGWMVGKNAMKDWKAAVRTWEKNEFDKPDQTKRRGRHFNKSNDEPIDIIEC